MEQDEEPDDAVGGCTDNRCHGAELGRSLGVADLPVGEAKHAIDEEKDDALEDESREGRMANRRRSERRKLMISLRQSCSTIFQTRLSCWLRSSRSMINSKFTF